MNFSLTPGALLLDLEGLFFRVEKKQKKSERKIQKVFLKTFDILKYFYAFVVKYFFYPFNVHNVYILYFSYNILHTSVVYFSSNVLQIYVLYFSSNVLQIFQIIENPAELENLETYQVNQFWEINVSLHHLTSLYFLQR